MTISKETNIVPRVSVTMGSMETSQTKWGQFPGPRIPDVGIVERKL